MSGKNSHKDTIDPAEPLEPQVGFSHDHSDSLTAASDDCKHGSNARGLTMYSCPECHARQEANIDEVLHIVLIREGWTEDELGQVTMQQFVQKPVSALRTDPAKSKAVQRGEFAHMVMAEQNARTDAARKWKAELDKSGKL